VHVGHIGVAATWAVGDLAAKVFLKAISRIALIGPQAERGDVLFRIAQENSFS
jgi:hypothetical protein